MDPSKPSQTSPAAAAESSSPSESTEAAAAEPPDLGELAAASRPLAIGRWTLDNKLIHMTPQGPKLKREAHEAVAGLTAGFINTTALFPINKLIFRQMAGGHGAGLAANQLKEEGLRYLYRGILPPLAQKMASSSMMFGTFGHYERWAQDKFRAAPALAHLVLAACMTGCTEAVLTPLERIQMLLQDRQFHGSYANTKDALVKLWHYGAPEYYRGLTCVLVRNGPSNILFFGLRNEIKKLMPARKTTTTPQPLDTAIATYDAPYTLTNRQYNMIQNFLSGAILGMFISTLFYPLSVVRTRMQTRPPGSKFLSIWATFNQVYDERGRRFSRLFRGCSINILKQFVSWGTTNCAYELALEALEGL